MRCANGLLSRLTPAKLCLPATCSCLLLLPAALQAQAVSSDPATTTSEAEVYQPGARHSNRLYFAMWTTHLKHDVVSLHNNWAIGISYRGFFGGTFLNSFGRRAFTGGIQRTIVSAEPRPIGASIGYRVGFVTGYDHRLMRIAGKTPVLPMAQPFASIDVQRVGFEVSYTFVVVSVAASYRF
jgi:hypothetical protein